MLAFFVRFILFNDSYCWIQSNPLNVTDWPQYDAIKTQNASQSFDPQFSVNQMRS